MIKYLANSDITVRPFKTYKNWEIQSIDSNATNSFGESTYFDTKIVISEGISCSGIFYTTGSPYYDPIKEPINSNGEYKRLVYSCVAEMFYNDYNNPLKLFGVESWDGDPLTGFKESRIIHDRVLVARIKNSYWGETIRPGTVRINDGSSVHDPYLITDDGSTNLSLSGNQFPFVSQISPHKHVGSKTYWDTSSGKFYHDDALITYQQALVLRESGEIVTYEPDINSWKTDDSTSRDTYQPENERFGYSVSAWYKYILAGSPMDSNSFSVAKHGNSQLFKYDTDTGTHRFVKKFISPFTVNGQAQEFGMDNSLLIQLEDGNFIYNDINSGENTSSLMDEFGYSVSIRDDFAVIGAPNGDACVSYNSHSGFVYVYGKNKGGTDNWGLVSILEGSGSNSRFGEAVSVDSDLVVVGAPGVNNNTGAVYVFRRKIFPNVDANLISCSTIETASFWNYVVNNNNLCERIVAESGEEIYGESGAPSFLIGSGSVILGDYSWRLEATLTSSVAIAGEFFGSTLEVNNNRIIIGSKTETRKGYATLFTASFFGSPCETASWGQYKIFYGNDDSADLDPLSPFNGVSSILPYDGFGRSVSIDGDHIVVCSHYDKSVGSPITQTIGAAYFYSFSNIRCNTSEGAVTNSFDCALRYKTYGDRSTIYNNKFARTASVRGTRAVISTHADKLNYSASYNQSENTFIFENSDVESENSYDQLNVLGRISLYDFDPKTIKWNNLKIEKRNKERDIPSYSYGWTSCLSDFISGSKFLVVGSPIFTYNNDSMYDRVIDKNYQRSGSFPTNYSGSLFVYDMDTLEENPKIGNVFYKNGQIILTNTASNYIPILTGTGSCGFSLTYQGEHTIFEHEYLITVGAGEFNYSTNPSSLVKYPITFDVNQDGIFDFSDVDLILRFLTKQKFYDANDLDDNGVILETDTLADESWWNNDIMMTEAGDVILNEKIGINLETTTVVLNSTIFNYIQTNLVDTGILDLDGNGQIDIRDGYLLLNYWSETLTPETIEKYTDKYSTRLFYIDYKNYISKYTGELNGFLIEPKFHEFINDSAYDPTGSYLSPVITTIGLYSNNQLVAISKLGRPLKNIVDWPLNIIVRFDT